jgi:hypothetical protein
MVDLNNGFIAYTHVYINIDFFVVIMTSFYFVFLYRMKGMEILAKVNCHVN